MYYFIADEHFGHKNIIKYNDRPFASVQEMDRELISIFNSIVKKGDITIHAGDFTLVKNRQKVYDTYVKKLNGKHIFLHGSHDYWLKGDHKINQRWEKNFTQAYIVVDHYNMRTWARSHYNSWMLYGHSHGSLAPTGKQHDIGVDNNDFKPLSFDDIVVIMNNRDDNPNLIQSRRK